MLYMKKLHKVGDIKQLKIIKIMKKEKLYRIKPELRGYFTGNIKDIHEPKDWWTACWVSDSALEKVADSPKITHICRTSTYGCGDGGATMTFVVNFNGVLGEDWNAKQRKTVEAKILGTISPLLVGRTWAELAWKKGEGL